MKLHNPELISALVDGELKGVRRLLLERHLRGCALCADEFRRLHHVREMLAAHPPKVEMSDSPEFFWSKVKRGIQAHEGETVEVSASQPGILDWLGAHRVAIASAVTICAAVCAITLISHVRHTMSPRPLVMTTVPAPTAISQGAPVVPVDKESEEAAQPTVEHVATALPETVATTVDTKDKDVTVIWVSGLPWTPTMADMKTKFANLDS
jgi:anti-sigma factor RsiW